ncbi:YhcN/YlaJ family sporulation lipoprotein [Halalkalibacter krulwichiae]|uniref:Sporulation lipoprotein YhcN/YlaJ (Spore_YhcN_YlaJ) n=1 Tax=Halalkalibacter krulwichiae TaxID=199441 RepID=A0A1X9MFD4_9BACI|nr:YhcN/YlaJ family sporulation lipoprotein [Halalkalibacter krulwichiae]ARK30231.1 Sporulation lipoprotein YhcN/YlaJ (Spore_YhcN_YlaJ) [Halalkalibacter krulwichiae]
MKWLVQLLFILCFLTACQMAEPQQDIKPLQLTNKAVVNQQQADDAKKIVLSMEEVIDVKGITDENNIYIAPRVKHFDRFRLKEIRKNGHDSIKKRYPDATIHVSTDQKIFMELEKLEKELQQRTISEERFKQRLAKLDEMIKG